jgi:hypothetical protein
MVKELIRHTNLLIRKFCEPNFFCREGSSKGGTVWTEILFDRKIPADYQPE